MYNILIVPNWKQHKCVLTKQGMNSLFYINTIESIAMGSDMKECHITLDKGIKKLYTM